MSSGVLHPKCGNRFPAGDRTGHCASCCESFYGLAAFDQHQSAADGRVSCSLPSTDGGKWWLDDSDRWHYGEKMSEEDKARIWPGSRQP